MIALADRYNLRDLGGLPTTDGRRVRSGLVFRSGSLAGMSADDLDALHQLGIALVIDLRSDTERLRAPASHALRTRVSDRQESGADLEAAWRRPGLTREGAAGLMTDLYRLLPDEQAEGYRMVFDAIAENTLPVLFHCAAGKDRTGVCAALLLDLLGVSRDLIARDYLQTQKTVARATVETRDAMKRLGVDLVDETALEPILNVDRAYIAGMFAAIEESYGSVPAYANRRLDLHASGIGRLRDLLLEELDS